LSDVPLRPGIMRRAFEALGVDYSQWRALSRAYALVSFAALRGVHGREESKRAALSLVAMVAFFAIIGVMPALVIWVARDMLLGATFMTSVTAGLVFLFVTTQNPSFVAPEDYGIIGFRPVSSRTYFAVRATGILSFTLVPAALTGYLPVLAFLTRSGGSWRIAAAAALAILGSALTTTLGLLAMYGWLLRLLKPERVNRVVMWIHTVVPLLMTIGVVAVMIVWVEDESFSLRSLKMPIAAWTLWYPGTWFAAYVEVARGGAPWPLVTVATLAAGLFLTFAATLRGRLSADYAARVMHLLSAAPRLTDTPARRWGSLTGEMRAAALLLRGHVRDDLSLQTALVMDLAMALFVVVVFVNDGLPADPFRPMDAGRGTLGVLAFWASALPSFFHRTLSTSASFEASWMFFTTPADRARLAASTRDVIAICTIGPMVIGLAALFLYAFGDLGHALGIAVTIGLISYTVLQLVTLHRPYLPLARPALTPGSGSAIPRGFLGPLAALLVATPLNILFLLVLTRAPAGLAWGLVGLVLVNAGLHYLTERFAPRRVPGYAG
jgi:hypothetical protein